MEVWPDIKFDKVLTVESVTLDKYVKDNNIDIIDFIWADVQGAEDLMLIGGKETFRHKVRFLYTEYAQTDNEAYYEHSPNRDVLLAMLGHRWEVIQDFGTDILLRNTAL